MPLPLCEGWGTMWQYGVCKLHKILYFRLCFNSDWGENVSFEKISTEHQCLSGEFGKIPLQNLSQPSGAQVSAGTKAVMYTLWRSWFYQAARGVPGQLWNTWTPGHLTSCSLRSLLPLPSGKSTFSWKISPCQCNPTTKTLGKGKLYKGSLFPDGPFTRSGGLWGLSSCQNSLDSHWNASEQWFC